MSTVETQLVAIEEVAKHIRSLGGQMKKAIDDLREKFTGLPVDIHDRLEDLEQEFVWSEDAAQEIQGCMTLVVEGLKKEREGQREEATT